MRALLLHVDRHVRERAYERNLRKIKTRVESEDGIKMDFME